MIITFKISPIFGVKRKRMMEKKQGKGCEYWVDEQRIEPNSFCSCKQKLNPFTGSVLRSDILTNKPLPGFLGTFVFFSFVKEQLRTIFEHKTIALEKKFGKFVA